MSGIEWFRCWHGAATDSKWLVIARRADTSPAIVAAVFWALLDYASQQPDRGSVESFDPETYSAWAGMDEEIVVRVVRELEAKGIIAEGRLAEWNKRQPQRERENDRSTSAERMRKHRASRRHVTPSDATVTTSDTTEDQSSPPPTERSHVTPSESETDSEKKKKQEPRDTRADVALEPRPKSFQQIVDQEFEEVFWPEYPHKVGKPKARVSFFATRKRATSAEIMTGLRRYIETKPPDRPWLNPATFLNQDRFNDEPAPVAARREAAEPAHDPMLRALASMAQNPADDDRRPELPQRPGADAGEPGRDRDGD